MKLVKLAALPALLALCAVGCSLPTESVRRAALVPSLEPIQRSGQPMTTSAEISAGSGSVARVFEPREQEGANAGLVIPRGQGHVAGRFRLTDELDVGAVWLYGSRKGAFSMSDDQPSPDHGNVQGAGLTAHYSAPTPNPDLRIGVAAEYQRVSVPWVEYRTCVSNCLGKPYTTVRRSQSRVPSRALALIPSYRVRDDVVVFGGMTLRNHPTIPRESIEYGSTSSSKLRAGPVNTIASAGVEYQSAFGPRFMLTVDQPLAGDPIWYGPSFGMGVSIPLGAKL
jgi:hypothetical protein